MNLIKNSITKMFFMDAWMSLLLSLGIIIYVLGMITDIYQFLIVGIIGMLSWAVFKQSEIDTCYHLSQTKKKVK